MSGSKRDPVSELLDPGARRFLERVYAARVGTWIETRLADPPGDVIAWAMAEHGIDILGPDNAPTLSGRHVNTHTRWGRAFERALYYQHKWFYDDRGRRGRALRTTQRLTAAPRPLQVEWGDRARALGVIPAGRIVRARLAVGGHTVRRVVQAKPETQRIYANDGTPVDRWAEKAGRDWS